MSRQLRVILNIEMCYIGVNIRMRMQLLKISASVKCDFHFYIFASALYDYYQLSAYEVMRVWIII